jgi:integrase
MSMATTAMPRPGRRRKPESGPCELDQLRDEIISKYYEQKPRGSTDTVRLVVRIATEHAGITRPTGLNDQGIARFVNAMDKEYAHLSDRTRAHYLTIFKGFCRKVHELGRIRLMPKFPAIPRPETFGNVKETPDLSPEMADQLLERLEAGIETWKGHRLYALVSTLMFTGLMRNEIFFVRTEDIDLKAGTIRVPKREKLGKSIRPSTIRFGAKLAEVLTAWLPLTGCEWVFPGSQGKRPWLFAGKAPYGARYELRAAGEAISLPNLSPLVLRKFYETNIESSLPRIEKLIDDRRAKRVAELKSLPGTCIVTLDEEGRRAFIRGRDMGILTPSRFELIKLLRDAGSAGLSAVELNRSVEDGWWKTLSRLRKSDPAWSEAIVFPGGPHGGNYRLAWGLK